MTASLTALLICVMVHEIGHAWVTFRLGGFVDEIVLGPLGGLGMMRGLPDPRAELLAHLAGPVMNLTICVVCAPLLVASGHPPWGLFWPPLAPEGLLVGTPGVIALKLALWINWVLGLVNFLPAFPFDGGRAFRAFLLVRWPYIGRRAASLIVAGLAKVTAVAICFAAFVLRFEDTQSLVPTQFALILLAIFLFFSAKQEEQRGEAEAREEGTAFGYALSRAGARTDRPADGEAPETSGPLGRWLERRRTLRLQREREQEAEDERQVDAILARLHEHGMQSLSNADRALLERVSARYRNRQRSGADRG
jgi:Zn-dependent protease